MGWAQDIASSVLSGSGNDDNSSAGSTAEGPSLLANPVAGPTPSSDATPQQQSVAQSDPTTSTDITASATALRTAADATDAMGKLSAILKTGGAGAQTVSLLQGQNSDTTGAVLDALQKSGTAASALSSANNQQINEANTAGVAAANNQGGLPSNPTSTAAQLASDINDRIVKSISLHKDIDDRLSSSFFDDPLKFLSARFGLQHQQKLAASVDAGLAGDQQVLGGVLRSQSEAFGIEDAAHKNISAAQDAAQQAVISADTQLKAVGAQRAAFQAGIPIAQLSLSTHAEQFREQMDNQQLSNANASLALATQAHALEQDKWQTMGPYMLALKKDTDLRVQATTEALQNKLGADRASNLSLSMSPLLGAINNDQLMMSKNPAQIAATHKLAQYHMDMIAQNPGVDPNTVPYADEPGSAFIGFKQADAPLNAGTRLLDERLLSKVWLPQETALSQSSLGEHASKDPAIRAALFNTGVPNTNVPGQFTAPGVYSLYKGESAERDEKAGIYTLPSIKSILTTGHNGAVPPALANNSLVQDLGVIGRADSVRPMNAQDVYEAAVNQITKAPAAERSALVDKLSGDVSSLMSYSNGFLQQTLNYNAYNLPVPSGYNKTVRTGGNFFGGGNTNIDWTNQVAVKNLLMRRAARVDQDTVGSIIGQQNSLSILGSN